MQIEQTALHKACSKGHIDLARVLTENGASVQQKDMVRMLYIHDYYVWFDRLLVIFHSNKTLYSRLS